MNGRNCFVRYSPQNTFFFVQLYITNFLAAYIFSFFQLLFVKKNVKNNVHFANMEAVFEQKSLLSKKEKKPPLIYPVVLIVIIDIKNALTVLYQY